MNPATACAVTLVDALVAQGVTDAVVCPGSRSAALAYAIQDADRASRIRMHVRVDERSAGFLALGLAKLSGRPVPVLTTSGTALANLHPAVLESSQASVPLLVLSADRPPELRGTGANQTTDQLHFFGRAVRWFHEVGTPAQGDDPRVWRAVAARAYAAAVGTMGSPAGPVHLNLPMREPLLPDHPDHPPAAEPPREAEPPPAPASTADLVQRTQPAPGPVVPDAPRTLMVLGDLPQPGQSADAVALARARGWPVVAEPFGRFDRTDVVAHGPLLLTAADWVERHRPGRVLVVGRPTLSRAVTAVLADDRSTVELVSALPQWTDPGHVAQRVYPWASVQASVQASLADPAEAGVGQDGGWLATWRQAGAAVAAAVDDVIAGSWPSGLAVASALVAGLPPGAVLFTGSSNPVRDLSLAMGARDSLSGVSVLANRGLAGIDGCVSTAVGVALSSPGRPAYALMGDLTFLHDANGLLIGPAEPRPDLTFVVVNDDGGGIFTLLEPGDPSRAEEFERVFGTPTGACIEALCRGHGVPHVLARSRADFADAVSDRPSGIRVVEVRVERGSHRGLHRRLRETAAQALA